MIGSFQVACRRIQYTTIRRIATEISPTTTLLRADERDNEVYLIGTSHISEKSANEIEELIDIVHPDKVFIELDPKRASQLMRDDTDLFQSRLLTAFENVSKNFPIPLPGGGDNTNREGSNFFKTFLERLKQHGLLPGTDMKAAILAAQRTNADIVYGDRPIDETLQAVKSALHPSMIFKVMSTPIPPEIQTVFSETGGSLSGLAASSEKVKKREFARLMLGWMEEAVPEIANAMVHQRDKIMATNLRQYCGTGKVIAVVGLIHLEGVQREWLKLRTEALNM